jgi:hypothetical protein
LLNGSTGIPAKAGIQFVQPRSWILVFAGMMDEIETSSKPQGWKTRLQRSYSEKYARKFESVLPTAAYKEDKSASSGFRKELQKHRN